MKCWHGYKKTGTHIGKSGHKVNTCEKIRKGPPKRKR